MSGGSGTITNCISCNVIQNSPGTNYSGANQYPIFPAGATERRVIEVWDLSSLGIPSTAIITSATLKFSWLSTAPIPTIQAWDCIVGGVIGTQATWNDKATGIPWTTPGGDLNSLITTISPPTTSSQSTNIDVKDAIQRAINLGIDPVFIFKAGNAPGGTNYPYTENDGTWYPTLTISWIDPPARADIGYFTLAGATLGNQPLRGDTREEITISDSSQVVASLYLSEDIFIVENINGTTYAYFNDTITLSEAQSYLSDYLAGVTGTITVPIDITETDYCAMIQESGQQFLLNGVTERAHIFTKQTNQKFNIDKKILPGDAVMFTCPDLTVAVGDEVIWDNKLFKVAESINHYFANTVIYVKHALQRVRYSQPVPQVLGLAASENLKGKTTLTWLGVDFPTFDHYEIWESVTGGATPDPITSVSATGPGIVLVRTGSAYAPGKYLAGGMISIQGSDGNDGDYYITAYQDNGGLDEIVLTLTKAWNITGALGNIVNMTHFYERDTTKSATKTIKNLIPRLTYYYVVRALDPYGNGGWWSNEANTAINTDKPSTPEGLR